MGPRPDDWFPASYRAITMMCYDADDWIKGWPHA
jgi:hypothetical protein